MDYRYREAGLEDAYDDELGDMNMVEQLARQEGTKLVDLRAAFLRDGRTPEELLCADGIHPSRSGQGIIYHTLCTEVA